MARNALIDPATKMLYPDLYVGGGGGGQVNSLLGGAGINIAGTAAIPQVNLAFTATVGEIMVGTGALAGAPLAPVVNGILSGVGGTPSYIVPGANNEVLKIVGGVPQFAVAAAAGLGEVLQVNNSALTPVGAIPQDATDFATLGCVKIETGTVGQGNNLALVVGEAGDNLQIKGATLLGSMLAGNGVNTEGLVAGANGLVLTANSAAANGLGVEWSANGTGTLTSITAGTNIGVDNTIPTAPVVRLLSPLTSTLNLGTQSITGSTSNITLSSGTNQANMNGNLGFTSVLQATPTQKANLFNSQISIETLANKVIMQPTAILKSVGTTAFQVGTVGSAPLHLIGGTGGADGISISQLANVGTNLTTSIANTKFYPDTYISNGDAITIGVPVPQVIHQRLTLNNLGLSNTSLWVDYGSTVFAGYSAFFRDSNNNMWLAENGSGRVEVWSNPPSAPALHTINMSGDSGGGTTRVNVFYEQGGYVFIGGSFTTINGNATSQGGIARVALSTYAEDPMFNSSTTENGIQGGEVFDMTDVAGVLEVVGSFTQTNTSATAQRLLTITDPYVSSSGTQTFIETNGGADNTCYTILFEPSNARVYYGGDFTNIGVNTSPVATNFIAYWDITATTWNVVDGNSFNAPVSKIVFNIGATYLYVVGQFNMMPSPHNCYLDLLTAAAIDSNLILSTDPNYQQAFSSGFALGVMDGTTFYREDSFQVWTSLGIPEATGTNITGINYDTSSSGDYKVIYNDYDKVLSHTIQPHSCVFTGSFKYDNTSYGNYTIVPRNVSQQFIGDITCSFWSIIGVGVGTFS